MAWGGERKGCKQVRGGLGRHRLGMAWGEGRKGCKQVRDGLGRRKERMQTG